MKKKNNNPVVFIISTITTSIVLAAIFIATSAFAADQGQGQDTSPKSNKGQVVCKRVLKKPQPGPKTIESFGTELVCKPASDWESDEDK